MALPSFQVSEETQKIVEVFKAIAFGGVMTYADLSEKVGFKVTNKNGHFRSAIDKAIKLGVTIRSHEQNVSFRRLTQLEMAEGRHRFRRIANQGKRGRFECREALRSNDKAVQAKASVSAAKYTLASGMKPTSNRDVPSDRI